MNDWFFGLCGFGLLLSLGKEKISPSSIFRQGLELFAGAAILASVYSFIPRLGLAVSYQSEFSVLFFFLGAYLVGRVFKKTGLFFLVVFGLVTFSRSLSSLAALAFGLSVFQFLFIGLTERLQFSPIPKPLAGLPIQLLTAGLLALTLSGILLVRL